MDLAFPGRITRMREAVADLWDLHARGASVAVTKRP
jgi:hypothetical protein